MNLSAVIRGDFISADHYNSILRLLRRRVTGPMVVETLEGWHIRRDPGKKQVMMARITGSTPVGDVFSYAWERVTLDPNGVVIPVPGGETGDVIRDFAINLHEIAYPPGDPIEIGAVVQLVLETKNVGQRFRTFVDGGAASEGGNGGDLIATRVVKMTQIVAGTARCVEITKPAVAVLIAADDGTVVLGFSRLISQEANFILNGAVPGMFLHILEGVSAGYHLITEIVSDVTIDTATTFSSNQLNVVFEITDANVDPAWGPDYSRIYEVDLGSTGPTHRFLPYIGPGDYVGNDGQTFAGQVGFFAANSNFSTPSNPVIPGMYVEIFSGPDAGRHLIVAVSATILFLATALTSNGVGLSFRVDITSEHATTLQLIGESSLVPDQNHLEVKIARAIHNVTQATEFDISREQNNTDARDLLTEIGGYLACYRLQVGANGITGLPVDSDVIIGVKPWRGHTVSGPLFFNAKGEPKYDLSDPDEPVVPIGWYRDHWRLEIAVARVVLHAPLEDELCEQVGPP